MCSSCIILKTRGCLQANPSCFNSEREFVSLRGNLRTPEFFRILNIAHQHLTFHHILLFLKTIVETSNCSRTQKQSIICSAHTSLSGMFLCCFLFILQKLFVQSEAHSELVHLALSERNHTLPVREGRAVDIQ